MPMKKVLLILIVYMFAGSVTRCPAGESSETGFTPGCSSDFPTDTFSPVVQVSRKTGNISHLLFGLNLEPVFSCSFADTGKGYAYDVRWAINGQSLKTVSNKPYSSIPDTDLRPADWKDVHQMNMLVACSVRARNATDSTPGFFSSSANFVAGVVADQTVYVVDEGSSIAFNIRSTVPIGCVGSTPFLLSKCKETIKIGYPRNESCSSVSSSSSSSSSASAVITETCGTDLVADDSLADHPIKVYGNVDSLYNQINPRTTTISFVHVSGARDVSGAWDNVIIPDIPVYIRDTDHQLVQRTCRAVTDPNYSTFDGTYYSRQISGEYVLYRHKREPYWIHTLSSACWWGTCNVGIAIRSHDSLFIVRTFDLIQNPTSDPLRPIYSGSRSFPMVDFRACDDKNIVITREGTYDFKVILPSGTEISFAVRYGYDTNGRGGFYFLQHVTIKPSVLDIGQTEGLCGFLSVNKDSSDDLQPRDTTTAQNVNTFIDSWYISKTSAESMFYGSPTFPDNYFYRPFCTCASQVTGDFAIANDFNEINCNLTEPADQCYDSTTNLDINLYSSCSKRKRREATFLERTHRYRRNIDDSDDIVDEPTPLKYADDFVENYIPPELDWPGDWTSESARAACEERFIGDKAVAVCIEYAQSNIEEYIVGCITDIKMTNSTTLVDAAVQTLVAGCIIEVSRNQTLILTNSEENGGESVLDAIKSQLCTNNCSNNGICMKGTCNCSAGYLGVDCSQTNAQPPSMGSIPGNGKCGTRQRGCQKTNINGNFESSDVWCKLLYFKIVNFIKEQSSTPVIRKAKYFSPDRISVLLESVRRRKRSTSDTNAEGYEISLSYDGTNFGESTSIIIYDEDCYDCNATTTTCISLNTCSLESTLDSTVSTTVESNNTSNSALSTEVTTSSQGNVQSSATSENSLSISTTETTTSQGNVPSSASTVSTTSQKTGNSESESEGGGVIMAVIISVVVICIIIAGVVIYLKFKPKNITPNIQESRTESNETYGSSPANSISDFNAPNIPPWNTHFQRGKSDISFDWATERPKTPEHLFLAKPWTSKEHILDQ